MSSTYKACRQLLKKHFLLRLPRQGWKKKFSEDLGFSSLEFVELIVYVEDFFGIQLSDAELAEIKTIRQLTDCIDRNMI
jgi:acyl carrier protein